MLGAILNFLTRSTLSVAAPTMMGELHISTQEYSYITGAFQVAIMFQPIVGYVLDTVGLKIGLAIFAAAWSVICMAHGLAHSWQGFAGLRALLGFAEGSANPAGMKVISEWFPARERGFAGGVYNIGASVGSMLAPPLVAWAILAYDWQTAFVITGGPRPGLGRGLAAAVPVACRQHGAERRRARPYRGRAGETSRT
ncbi:MAG: MFS transporter [Rhizomicrobium sp.]